MKRFIEIIDSNKKRRFLNIDHIEEVVESNENSCYIYMAFNSPNNEEQDYFLVDKPYDEIVSMILENMSLYEDIKTGLEEAIAYERCNYENR